MGGARTDRSHRHRYAVAAVILLAGLVAAAVIYVRAAASPPTPLELSPETSKKYLRDLQMYGGTANVLAVELEGWFERLWHGRTLAYTVAGLSLAVSVGYLFFAVVLPPYRDPGSADDRS